MKKNKVLSLLLSLSLILVLCAFTGIRNETDTADAADGEIALENFVNKLQEGNYVVAPESYVKTVVYSPEQVYFVDQDASSSLNNALITLDGETFAAPLEEDGIAEVEFAGPETAIDAAGLLLPNAWLTVSDGNLFNLFYNYAEAPLEFISYEDSVKTTLLGLAGYSKTALDSMGEVHMLLDAEDPSSVHFTAVMESSGMIHYDDLDLTLEFGVAESDPRIEAWLNDPVFPPTRTEWTEDDIIMLDTVFQKDYGTEAVPFPAFASYAMVFDPDAYMESSEIFLTDAHGTEEDLEGYVQTLLDAGYEEAEVTLEDETSVTVYRKLLREDYNAYAELYPFFDNGFALEGRLYYETPEYEGIEAINGVLTENGFAALDETDLFPEWKAENTAARRSESWLYYFDYNLYMGFLLETEDEDAARAYLADYSQKLLDEGFLNSVSRENSKEFVSANEFVSFKYEFLEDGTISMLFKNEKTKTPEEAKALIEEHGIPVPDLFGDLGVRDVTRYRYNIGEFRGLFLGVYQPFESEAEADQFLMDYTATLEEMDYLPTDPMKIGSQRQNVYLNQDLGKYVGFDLWSGENDVTVFFEFVSIEPEEEESILEGFFRR